MCIIPINLQRRLGILNLFRTTLNIRISPAFSLVFYIPCLSYTPSFHTNFTEYSLHIVSVQFLRPKLCYKYLQILRNSTVSGSQHVECFQCSHENLLGIFNKFATSWRWRRVRESEKGGEREREENNLNNSSLRIVCIFVFNLTFN